MFAYRTPTTALRHRARLLTGCAVAAAAIGSPAVAQRAFQAIPQSTVGPGYSINQTAPLDTVTIDAPQAVINWTPTDMATGGGAINILAAGAELRFTANPDFVPQYTVLNRVIPVDPSRAIKFDGKVTGQFDAGYGATTGGNIWFYSPGGIIAGATSTFDVGSLVLSATNIDSTDGLFGTLNGTDQSGTIRFRGVADSKSFVNIEAGAKINATSNYVALVAPRVQQAGLINVNGSAALVAAESADIIIPVSGGLFNIVVYSGSKVDTPGETTLSHSGTTAIKDEQAFGDPRQAYLVAVPKNDAVTMLVSGSVGYDAASQVQAVHGTVILTTGDVVVGTAYNNADAGQVKVTGGDFNTRVAINSQDVIVDTTTAALNFGGNLDIRATSGALDVTAVGGKNITVAGDLNAQHVAGNLDGSSAIGVSVNAGSTLSANNISLKTNTFGAAESGYGVDPAQAAKGGLISVVADGGIITTTGGIEFNARGFGGDADVKAGATGTGGTINVVALNDGKLLASGALNFSATGSGGNSDQADGGAASGGSVNIDLSGGAQLMAGSAYFEAAASGGDGGSTALGGSATGGSATLSVKTGGFRTNQFTTLEVSASGGEGGGLSGSATGGTASLLTTNATVEIFQGLQVLANAFGGGTFFSTSGGDAQAGKIDITGTGGALTIALGEGVATRLEAKAASGFGFDRSGDSTGGAITVGLTGITAALQNLNGNASATVASESAADISDRFADNGGDAAGGSVAYAFTNANVDAASIGIDVNGQGGLGGASDIDGVTITGTKAGSGTGGKAQLNATIGSLDVSVIVLDARGLGGDSHGSEDVEFGGAGLGGDISLALSGVALSSISQFSLYATGQGGGGDASAGGAGTGGKIAVTAAAASILEVTETFELIAKGEGSDGFNFGGAALGGAIDMVADGGSFSAFYDIDASAFGGAAFGGGGAFDQTGAIAGAAKGGSVAIVSKGDGGVFGSGSIDANGEGGRGFDVFGGGDGTGGAIALTAFGGIIALGTFDINANGIGGDANDANTATFGRGGSIDIQLNNRSTFFPDSLFNFDDLTLRANGAIFDSSEGSPVPSNGGTGVGGTVNMAITGGLSSGNKLVMYADGFGGAGSANFGSAGGAGFQGRVGFSVSGGEVTITDSLRLYAGGFGSDSFSQDFFTSFSAGNGGDGGVGPNPYGAGAGAYVSLTGGLLSTPVLEIDASNFGGDGGFGTDISGAPNNGGDGGNAAGGIASFFASGTAATDIGDMTVTAAAFGGDGGDVEYGYGSPAPADAFGGLGGIATGGEATISITGSGLNALGVVHAQADGTGGNGGSLFHVDGVSLVGSGTGLSGGAGRGGTATISIGTTLTDGADLIANANGVGRDGGSGPQGGSGGNAEGGVALIEVTGGNNFVDQLTASAIALAGSGASGDSSHGGFGGFAIGGIADIRISGAATTISTAGLFASGFASAGNGGSGGTDFESGGPGGDGNVGGEASGGSAKFNISGGSLTLTGFESVAEFKAGAVGGSGGNGGDSADGESPAGSGGAGGNGIGGDVRLVASAGQIDLPATLLTADGEGGSNGQDGGFAVTAGNAGDGIGGNILLSAGGAPDAFLKLGATTLSADGISGLGSSTSGRIEIKSSAHPSVPIQFASLDAHSRSAGYDSNSVSGIFLSVADAPIVVTGSASLDARGPISFGFDGSGSLLAQSGSIVASSSDGIAVSHSNPVGTPSISAGGISLTANGSIFTGPGSLLQSTNGNIDLQAFGGSATLDAADAAGNITVRADGDVTLGSANAVNLTLYGGRADFSGSITSGRDTTVTGLVILGGNANISASRDAIFTAGAEMIADRLVSITSGDDIIIANGSRIVAAANAPAETGYGASDPLQQASQLKLFAGGLSVDPVDGNVSSILIGGQLESPGRTIQLRAGAIVGDGVLTSENLYARIDNAPVADQVPSNDFGQLSGACLEGSICLDTAFIYDTVRIGESGFEPINLQFAGFIDAKDVLLRSLGEVRLGRADGSRSIKSSGNLTIDAANGNLTLLGFLSITGGPLSRISTTSNIVGPEASITATNTLDIYAANNITLDRITAQGIRTVAPDSTVLNPIGITIPGALNVGTIDVGSNLDLTAANGITVAQLDSANLTADASNGEIAFGTIVTGNIAANAATNLSFSDLLANNVSLSAGASLTGGSLNSGDFAASAGTGLTLTNSTTAAFVVKVTNGTADLGSVTADSIDASASEAIQFIALTSVGTVDLVANGSIDGGSLSGGDVSLSAVSGITTSKVGAANFVANVSAGSATLGLVSSNASIQVDASQDIAFDDLTSVNGIDLDAGGGILGGSLTGGILTLSAISGLTITNANATDFSADVSSGSTAFGLITSDTGIQVSASGAIVFDDFTAGGDITLGAGSNVLGGDVSGAAVAINGANGIALDALASTGLTTLKSASGAILVADASAPSGIDATGKSVSLAGTNGLKINQATATAGDVTLKTSAGALSFTALDATGAITADAAGDVTGGNASAATIDFKSSGALSANQFTATAGTLSASGKNGVTLTNLVSAGAATLIASAGQVKVSNVIAAPAGITASGTAINLRGVSDLKVTSATATAGNVLLSTQSGPLFVDNASATGLLSLAAVGNVTVGGTASGGSVSVSTSGALSGNKLAATAGNLTASATGITLDRIAATGTAKLTASSGGVTIVTDAAVTGGITASGKSVTLNGATGLNVTQADATAGDVTLKTTGGVLNFTTLTASGAVTADASGNASGGNATGASIDFKSSGALVANQLTAKSGTLSASGKNGITLAGLSSAGAATLSASAGQILVTKVASAPAGITASGTSVDLTGNNELKVTNAVATAGDVLLATTSGPLFVTAASATDLLGLVSTGEISVGTASGARVSVDASGGLSGTSLSATGGNLIANAAVISLDRIAATGTANLTATKDRVLIGTDAAVAGGITASGTAVTLNGLTGLNVTKADATKGDLALTTQSGTLAAGTSTASGLIALDGAGPVTFTKLTAAGAVSIDASGDITGGDARGSAIAIDTAGALKAATLTTDVGNLDVSAQNGVTLDALAVTGLATLKSASGAISVVDASGASSIDANGKSVSLAGANGLKINQATATAGDVTLKTTGGVLSFTALNATGAIKADAAGNATGGNASAATIDFKSIGALSANQFTATSGTLSASGKNGVTLTNLVSAGAVTLTANTGQVAGQVKVSNVISAPAGITASGTAINLRGVSDLKVTSATATAGNVLLSTQSGPLFVDTASATGLLSLAAVGNVTVGGTASGGTVSVSTSGALSGNKLTATAGNLTASATGITLDRIAATGTAKLTASSGDVTIITDAAVTGGITASGKSVALRGATGLNVTQADATAGDVKLSAFGGTLAAGNATATGAVTLSSTAPVTFSNLKAGGAVSINTFGNVTGGSARGGTIAIATDGAFSGIKLISDVGNLDVSAKNGITLDSFASAGAASVKAIDGAVKVTTDAVASGGIVTRARSVSLNGQNGLDITQAVATAGDVKLTTTGGPLFVQDAQASNAITLGSNATIDYDTLIAGGLLTIDAAGDISGGSAQAGAVDISGSSAINLGDLAAIGGPLTIFAQGPLSIDTVSTPSLAELVSGSGFVQVVTDISAGAIFASGTEVTLSGQNGLNQVQAFASAGDILLDTAAGPLDVDKAQAAGNISLLGAGGVRFVDLKAGGAIAVQAQAMIQAGAATGTDIFMTTPGGISVIGKLDAISPSLGTSGAIDLQAGDTIAVGATASLLADQGLTLAAGNDVLIAGGAKLTAARATPADASAPLAQAAQLQIGAGIGGAPNLPAQLGSIVIGSAAEIDGRTVVLSADAIQTDTTSLIKAGNLYARITDAPALGGPASDDGGLLSASCVQGNVCLGGLSVSGVIRIGELGFVPNRISLNGGFSADDIGLRSRDSLGFANDVTAASALQIQSTDTDVTIASGVTLKVNNGDLSIVAGRDVLGGGATVSTTGLFGLAAGRNVALGNVTAGGLRGADSSGVLAGAVGFLGTGNFFVSGTLAIGSGPVNVKTSGAIDVQSVATAAGADVDFIGGGAVRLGQAGAATTPGAISLAGNGVTVDAIKAASLAIDGKAGAATIGKAQTSGNLFAGGGSIAFSDIAAGGSVILKGSSGPIAGGSAQGATLSIATPATLTANKLAATSGGATIDASGGIALAGLSAPGPIKLTASGGAIDVAAVSGPSGLAASGKSVTLTGPNGLTIQSVIATAGDAKLTTTAGLLAAGNTQASGALSLNSAGAVTFGTLKAGDALKIGAQGDVSGTSATGGSITLAATGALTADTLTAVSGPLSAKADGGIALVNLTSPAAVTLQAVNGAIKVNNASAGGIAALGRSIDISGLNGLVITQASATAGDIRLAPAQGALMIGDAAATGAIALFGDAVSFQSLTAGGALSITAKGDIAGGTASAASLAIVTPKGFSATALKADTGPLKISAGTGIALDRFTAAGEAQLLSSGAISVKTDAVGKGIIANGASIALTGQNGLSVASATATAGDAALTVIKGPLEAGLTKASGAITLVGGGPVSFTNLTAGGAIGIAAQGDVTNGFVDGKTISITTPGALSASGLTATGAVDVAAASGIQALFLSTPGTASLVASNGAIKVTDAAAAGGITASGQSIDLTAKNGLSIANATTTKGNLRLASGGALSIGSATSASGALLDGSSVAFTNVSAAGTLAITSDTDVAGGSASAASMSITGPDGIALASLNSAGTATLTGGAIVVDDATATDLTATGTSVQLTGKAGLTVTQATATAGDVTLTALAGGLAAGTTKASGAIALTGAGPVSFTSLDAGGAVNIAAQGDVAGGFVGAKTFTVATPGALTVGNASAAGGITASAASIDLTGLNGLAVTSATATNGQLLLTATNGALNVGASSSTGATKLTATGGAITVADASAIDGVTALGTSVSLTGKNGLNVTQATATAGDAALTALAGPLAAGTTAASGAITLTGGDPVTFASLKAGNGITINGQGDVTGGSTSGATLAVATPGAIQIAAVSAPGGVTASGKSVNLSGPDGLKIVQATASGGDITLASLAGALDAGTSTASGAISLNGAGTIAFSKLNAGGAVGIAAQGDISGGSATGGSIAITTPGKIDADNLAALNGSLSVIATKGVTLDTAMSSGTTTLKADQGVVTVASDVKPGEGLIVNAPTINLTAQNGLNIAQATATSGDLVLTTVSGALIAGNSSATGGITLNGASTVGFTSLKAQQGVTIKAAGAITGGSASGTTIAVTTPGVLNAGSLTATSGGVTVDATGGISLASIASAGAVTLGAGAGAIKVATDLASAGPIQATAQAISLNALGGLNLTKGVATAGDLVLTSANGGITLGQASATASLLGTAALGTMTVNGSAVGSTIALTSKDIVIAPTAQLGSAAQTSGLTLTSTADRVFLGASDSTTGYRLDNSELARIATKGSVSIVSAPLSQTSTAFNLINPLSSNIVVGAMTFEGAQLGSNGVFSVASPSSIGVTGNVQFKNFQPGQTVTFQSLGDVSLAAEGGLVTVKDGNGVLAGTLRLQAQNVHAMSSAKRSEIPDLTLNDAKQRLGTNDQVENDGGYFQAGNIVVRISRLVFIQNSGANGTDPNLSRGFTTNSLTIEATGDDPAQAVINGRVGAAVGGDVIANTKLIGDFDPNSGFNGCSSFGVSCGDGGVLELAGPTFSAARDQIQSEEEEDEKEEALQASQSTPDPVIQIMNAPSSRFDPLIDEPITGAGNEDLWETVAPIP